jgi:hypothetical protein
MVTRLAMAARATSLRATPKGTTTERVIGILVTILDNYNRLAVLELEDQRSKIKTKHREALEEIRRKQALAAKEAEAKKAKQ